MRSIFIKSVLACVLLFSAFSFSGCFSTLQTAKTTNGFSFTSGLYNYSTKEYRDSKSFYEDHYLLILMPRWGRRATETRIGLEGGARFISDAIDRYEKEDLLWILSEEFKLQIPRNRYLDLAFGAEFWWFFPGSISIFASKDLGKTFTPYGRMEFFGALYNITLREREDGFYPKLTLGSEINFHKNFSALVEIERWFDTGESSRENTRFAAGIKVCPGKED
jgi:hypothetical protein